MKNWLHYVIICIICVLTNISFAQQTEENQLLTFREDVELLNSEQIPIQIREELKSQWTSPTFNSPETTDSVKGEALVVHHYYLGENPLNTVFKYKGEHRIEIDSSVMNLVDSLFNNEDIKELVSLADEFLGQNENNIQLLVSQTFIEYERFQEEKQLKAIAYSVSYAFFGILCGFLLYFLHRYDIARYLLVLSIIAALIGTIQNIPDLIIFLKGCDYSVLNSIR